LDKPATWESIGGIDRVIDPDIDDRGRLLGFTFDTEVGGKAYRGLATSSTRKEGRRMGWDIENSEIAGTIMVGLAPIERGTTLTVDLTVASKGLLSGMFFSVISKSIGSGLPRSVDAFAAGLSEPRHLHGE
jgi:hypothetical protein